MKKLRKLVGVSVLCVIIFMVVALFQYQNGDDLPALLPDQMEYEYNQGWLAVPLNGAKEPGAKLQSHLEIKEQFQDALEQGECEPVDLPYVGECGAGEAFVFQNTLPEEYAGLTLSFSSTHSTVRVVLDDEVIYQYGYEEGHETEKSHGSNENYVRIPNIFEKGDLWIEMASAVPNAAAELKSVKIETRDVMVIGVVGNRVSDIGCCLLIVIMAIIMFVLAIIRRYTRQPVRGEFFLGLAGLAAGVYCFIGTDTLSIFYNVQEAYEMQEYLVMMFPMFLMLYLERNLYQFFPRRFFVLFWAVIGNAAVQILLQWLGIRSMEEMVNISAAVTGIVCITAIISLVQLDYKNKSHQTVFFIFSMLVLLSGGIANVIMNYMLQDPYGNTAGQYSMTVFGILMAVIHTLQLSKEYRASAEENALLLEEKVKAAEQQNLLLAQAKTDADAARHEAMAANEAKGKFLARMSHEIRTPINAVLGMDEMILRESKEQQIRDYAMDIYTAGQTLLSLINDILDFSKIDSGKMEIVPVEYDVSSLIHDLANMASQRAKGKGIEFVVEADQGIPSRLYGDDVRIRQVLTNILTNAVKYTPEGTVWMRIRSLESDGPAVLWFEVEDTGMGIKEEDLPKLSAEFERIEEERNRNIEGTGLGMSITIQLLTLMGSKLLVKSEYGKGSKFYFQLEQEIVDSTPIGDFESRARQLAENYTYGTKFLAPDAEVLVVDDNAVNRKVFRNLLKETEIRVTEAGGGRECLELVQAYHYDLIFLDHMMPEMDGVETFRRIKGLTEFPCKDTPIVVLTANAVSGARESYLAEGFDDFLSKPIVPEKLEEMLKKMLPAELLQEAPDHGLEGNAGGTQASVSLDELPQVDGLDWNYAWLHLPDLELLEYTVREFYGQIDSAAGHLEEAFWNLEEPGQLDQYRIQVHAMKSLAATIGIVPLAGLAKILEYAAKGGKIEEIHAMTGSFLEEWRSYRQKLQGVFGIEEKAKEEVADYSVIKALVEMVRVSMEELDIDQADRLMGQLQSYEYPEGLGEQIRGLQESVTNLDAEGASHFADLLIGQMGR